MRKIVIKTLGLFLVLVGVFSIIHSFVSFITALNGKNEINVYIPISALFLLYAGFNLYRLKETGRKLTIFLFLLQAVLNIGIMVMVFLLEGKSFQFWINFPDQKYIFAENRIVFAAIMLTLAFTIILLILFLLQNKTRELFLSEEPSNQP